MEENNSQNQNVETQNNNSIAKNDNKMLIALMALVIVVLVGYIVYTKFIEKEPDKPKENSTQENNTSVDNDNNNQTENNDQKIENTQTESNSNKNEKPVTNNVDKNIYKSSDGKHTLNVKDFNNKSNPKLVYDGKSISVVKDDEGPSGYYETKGKYAVYGDGNGQCGTYFFVVNTENNTLVNLDVQSHNYVEKIGNNYYFFQKKFCGGDGFDLYNGVYTESLKKIGTAFFGEDEYNNFYVLDNGMVVKYDQNAKELYRGSKKYNQEKIIDWYTSNSCEPVVVDGNLYFVYSGDNSINYLVDIVAGKEIQINKKNDSEYKMSFFGCNFDGGSNKFVFTYELESCGSGCWSDNLIYTYDIKTGNLTSKVEKTESTSYTE